MVGAQDGRLVVRVEPGRAQPDTIGGGSRRGVLIYVVAVATYAGVGVAWKPVLNWIAGPIWMVVVAGVLPAAVGRLATKVR